MHLQRRSLFGAGALGALAALSACSSPPSPQPDRLPATTPSATSATPTPTPTATLADPLPKGVVNALVFGTDSRDRTSLVGNADAIVLAQLSADRSRLTLVSIARDTYVSINGKQGKVNSAFARGGTPLLRESVSALFGGLPIQMTAQANFNMFINITRRLGGIVVTNRHANQTKVLSTGRIVDFPAGEITLTGTDGLIYARERKKLPNGDLDRAERHRALIIGMLRGLQSTARNQPDAFAAVAAHIIGNVKVTGFDKAQVADLASPLLAIDLAQTHSLMVPIARFDTVNGASGNVVAEARNADLGAALRAGDVGPYVVRYGSGYAVGG